MHVRVCLLSLQCSKQLGMFLKLGFFSILKMALTPKGRERPNLAFLIVGRLPKLDNRLDSCEILHNRVLPRVLANKTIFIKNT